MKSFIAPTYTFTPGLSGVGTVNLSGISGFNIKYLVSIINQTRGELVYSTASASLRFTNVTGTTVTLFKDTSTMSSGDVLQVIYEDQSKQEVAISNLDSSILVSGVSAVGVAPTLNPISISGVDAGGLSRRLLTDASGRVEMASAQSLPLPTGAATAARQDTGNTSVASIDSKTPALDNSKQPVIPSMTSGGNLSVQTAATGTNWTAFASQALKQLTISNQTGVTIEFRQSGAGVGFQIPTGTFYTFFGITNANQLEARRVDTLNAQVTITARWET